MQNPPRSRLLVSAILLFVAAACEPAVEETTVRRGDVAFATDSVEEALAEYRLAVRQGDGEPEVLARVAHAYVALGRVDEAAEYYRQAVSLDEDLRTQAVSDLMGMARRAADTGERFQMASAVQEALAMEPAIGLDDMALPLARHYFENGEYGQALPLYQRSLKSGADSIPAVVFEIGRVYREIEDCENGLVFFERFREMVRASRRGEVDWYIGQCSFERSNELRRRPDVSDDDLEEALSLVDRVIDVGEPRSLLGEAWYERGELLARLGRCEEAMESFAQVRVAEGAGTGSLVQRAQQRFDEIYFGQGLQEFRPDRPCG
ncbi:MAG TPA: tetratricopeptide repeat protein [Longimicrobiales bacterium]|nr:tetratricopeptide repeat protein [Longimicrobiales bacterium]